jgi:hypothetical protein
VMCPRIVYTDLNGLICKMRVTVEDCSLRYCSVIRTAGRSGNDIHVMLALRRSSRQVVVAYEELDSTNMVGKLLRK